MSVSKSYVLRATALLLAASTWTSCGHHLGTPATTPMTEAQAFSDLLNELNAALFDPRHASARDKPLLRDAGALILAYHNRITQLFPLTAQNDRIARAIVDYMAIVRGWPPVLNRTTLAQISPLGALKAVIIMDKCLGRNASGTVTKGSDCETIDFSDL
ncbi:hypothetical protein WDW37_01770 [Bdellovibrionota bacterium FG-1]